MHNRGRKFVGTIAILVFVIVYALAVVALAQPVLRGAGQLTTLLFYAVAGMAWILPIMPLIAWMERRKP